MFFQMKAPKLFMFQNDMIPARNKPTRVTRKTTFTINHLPTNFSTETVFETSSFKK